MSYFFVDVEADGPCPGLYSMVSFGAVKYTHDDLTLNTTFYGKTRPLTTNYNLEALKISCPDRKTHESYDQPAVVMGEFNKWVSDNNTGSRPIFMSDNPAFDWQWINYYFHITIGSTPFGYSARRIGDVYCGAMGNMRAKWKHLRQTPHDHNPVNDAKGNAEAFRVIQEMLLDVKEFRKN
tara:strand:+ start:1075 stop:1614 length:540 start_codon:yes stop_codon:yes gene_type:complete